LTKRDAYQIIRLIILCAFVLGVLGIGAWLAPQIIKSMSGPIVKSAEPSLRAPSPPPPSPTHPPNSSKLSFEDEWIDNPPTDSTPGLVATIPKGWKQDEADAALIAYHPINGEAEDRFILY
jgi:hypothetical protein